MINILNNSNSRFLFTQKMALYGLPILAIIGITLPILVGQKDLSLLASYLVIPMIFAPIAYRINSNDSTMYNKYDERIFKVLIIIYFFSLAISIYLLYAYNIRPTIYYVIISIMAISILLEILAFDNSRIRTILILVQIMIIILDVTWGVTLKYYYFIGRTDLIAHVWIIENLIKNGYTTDVLWDYKAFQLWHILVSCVYYIAKIPLTIHKTALVTNAIIFSFLIVFSFLLSSKLFNDRKISLLSVLLVCFYPDVIFYSMYSIARSVVMPLQILLLWNLFSKEKNRILLSLLLSIALIMYHQVSMLFILIIFIIIIFLRKLYFIGYKYIEIKYILCVIIINVFYWMYYSEELFSLLVNIVFESKPPGVLTHQVLNVPLSELLNYSQYSILLLFIIFGFLSMNDFCKQKKLAKIFIIVGLISVAVSFPGPASIFDMLVKNMNIARFGEHTFFFSCIAGGYGIFSMYLRSRNFSKIIILSLVFLMFFLCISNDFTASDNPIIKRPFYTYYLTQSEVISLNQIADHSDGHLLGDYVTWRYFDFSKYKNISYPLSINKKTNKFSKYSEIDIILIRNGELQKRPLKLISSSSNKPVYQPYNYFYIDLPIWNSLNSFRKIYDSQVINVYI